MTVSMKELEESARHAAQALDYALNEAGERERIGFCVFLFEFGEGRNLTYISNAKREDMIKAVKEWLIHAIRQDVPPPPGGGMG